jgi:thymidylate kinase
MHYLQQKGYKCKYVWGASRPLLSYAFFALTKILGYWKTTKENAYTDPLEFAPRNTAEKLAALYRLLLFLDHQIRTTVKIRLVLAAGKTVVCDRYFYDMLMELKRSSILTGRFVSAVWKTSPKPVVAFLLDTPEGVMHQRRGFPVKDLTSKRTTYLKMAKTFGFIVVDSTKEFLGNQEKIRSLVLKHLAQ